MKNRIRFAVLSFAVLALGFTSCHRHEHVHPTHTVTWQTTTVDSVISANYTLVMILPANMSEETPIISTDAKNASVSTLIKDSATGNWVYTYTPTTDYTGTDQVICTTFVQLNGNVIVGNSGNATWTQIQGTGLIGNPNAAVTTVNNLSAGVNRFVYSITTPDRKSVV